ncbi:hypothetical protein [Sandaracinus amylolyticus]|uniref:Uncharacterized protein n=1 Tax=Sandaracinus amylolyticus TaxID=927083 RepID=A0A0F6YG91_9BACT|nr:hypothetical protein [Sandaracinus amylolyticus]AKF03432.1 hypothetical protein DB32_000581 [Sandaracinus amylolyticus]
MERSKLWTLDGLLEARAAAAALLEQLGLEGFVFEIEPRVDTEDVVVLVEWVRGGPEGTWTSTRVVVDGELLLRSRNDDASRDRLLAQLRARIHGEGSPSRDAHA